MENLLHFHQEAKLIDSFIQHNLEEIKLSKVDLKQKTHEAIDLKCMISLRSAYYLRITPSTSLNDSKLSFINTIELNPANSINDIKVLGSLKNDATQFLNAIIRGLDKLPDCLSSVDSAALIEAKSFIPEFFEPLSFFASSTLPSLFGYCWTDDFVKAYINFLSHVANNLPPSTFDNFRSHWLYDCYKNFIFKSSISKFLEPSLSGPLMELAKDESITTPLRSNNQTELFNNLIKYAEMMIKNMNDNIMLFPPEVSILIKSFGETAETEEQKLRRYEILFIDCVLAPAISFPKTYSLFPPTYNFILDAAGSSRAMQVLAQIFRLIMHPAQAKLRYTKVNHEKLASLPFSQLLTEIATPTTTDIGIKFGDILPLLEEKSIDLLFSAPDLYMIALAIRSSKSVPNSLQMASVIASKLTAQGRNLPLDYFRFDTLDIRAYVTNTNDSPPIKLQTAPPTPINAAATALFEFLRFAGIDRNAPTEISNFLEYHRRVAQLSSDFMKNTYLNNIIRKMMEVPPHDIPNIMEALSDEISRHRVFIARSVNQITQITLMIENIVHEIESLKTQGSQLLPVMYSNLLDSFFSAYPDIKPEFKEKRQSFLMDKELFKVFLGNVEDKIVQFLGQSSRAFSEGVAQHFHTWMMQHMPLSEFKKIHPEFEHDDNVLYNVMNNEKVIEQICVAPSPKKIREIMNGKNFFVYVHQELMNAANIELPVEAGSHIATAIELITTIFVLSIGGMPQADDMTPILNFVLLTSGIPNIHSFASYLQHFFHDINRKEFKIIPENIMIAVTHIINHATSLSAVIQEL